MAKAKRRRPAPRLQPVAPANKPIGRWIAYGAVAAVLVGLVVIIANPPADIPEELPPGTEEVAVGDPSHVEGPIQYDREVPAGGQHNPLPVACAIYDEPLPPENVVHTLEHGAVWITYQDEDAVNLGALERLARSRSKVVLSPVPTQDSPVLATAWGWQLALQEVDSDVLRQFIQAVQGDFSKAPESGVSC